MRFTFVCILLFGRIRYRWYTWWGLMGGFWVGIKQLLRSINIG